MRLLHYSREPLITVRSVDQTGKGAGVYKPRGLWVSVEGDDDWPTWCQAEDFGLDRMAWVTEIDVDLSRVLVLDTERAVRDFADAYGSFNRYSIRVIDWSSVASACGGLVIAPYQWGLRLAEDFDWYYGWDCASGCIWDASAVRGLAPASAPEVSMA